MKAIIEKVEFQKEYTNEFGLFYLFKITHEKGYGLYSSKSRDQKKFVKGQETEFTEEAKESKGVKWTKISPVRSTNFSQQNRAIRKEQTRYSGFAMAYAKDLVVASKIEIEQMYVEAQCMVDWMVETDKSIES